MGRASFVGLLPRLVLAVIGRGFVVSGTKAFLRVSQEPRFDLRVAHVISPVPWKDEVQDAVLRSLVAAKQHAEDWRPSSLKINVSIHAAQVAGESAIPLPVGIQRAAFLHRSTATEYGCRRSIPFPADMMNTLQSEAPDAALFVLSNADIAVVPEFYQWIVTKYLMEVKAMNILKVMIPRTCRGQFVGNDLAAAYEVARRLPQTHPGSDMFVWDASKTDSIIASTGDVFFGYPPVGQVIQDAMSQELQVSIVRGEHLTFHFGAEGEHGRGDPGVVKYPDIPEICTFESQDTPESSNESADHQDCDYVDLNMKEGLRRSSNLRSQMEWQRRQQRQQSQQEFEQ